MLERRPDPAAPATATWEVTAIRYGSLRARRSELFYRWSSYGDADGEVEMAYWFWLLRRAGRTVLVDTGFDPAVGARKGRTVEVEPVAALARLGVAPEEVDAIVVTHLHYDHVGNLAAYPGAELIVPRTELDFWFGPLAARAQFAQHVEAAELATVRAALDAGRVRTTAGEAEVLPGLRALEVGGHSPGQQLVVVEAERGKVVIASDAVHFYEELELDRPFGVFADLGAMYRGYDRVRELTREEGAALVVGHDPAVMERFAPSRDGSGIAVRVNANSSEERERHE
jgi:glyoxylase-like metal-dependent hydrolase (beta-lactamase superfamily II)